MPADGVVEPLDVVEHVRPGGVETPAGGSWKYNTGDSYLVSAVMEGATGTNLADYLARIWHRHGTEADASWWSECPDGMTVAGSGFNARLRDYSRFGQFVLDEGRIGSDKFLPDGWNAEAGSSLPHRHRTHPVWLHVVDSRP